MQAGSGWCFLNGVAVCSRALAAPAHLAGFNVPSTIIYMSLLCLFFTAVVLCRGAVFFPLPPFPPSFLSDSLWLHFLFVLFCVFPLCVSMSPLFLHCPSAFFTFSVHPFTCKATFRKQYEGFTMFFEHTP